MTDGTAWCLVPAAGTGSRMGGALPKQYLPLAGATVLEHSLRALVAMRPAGILVVVAPDDSHWRQLPLPGGVDVAAVGGASRADSVRAGLEVLAARAASEDLVLVHDAARPCVDADSLQRLLEAAGRCGDGALLARPVADTVKRAGDDPPRSVATVDREGLWLAQTPQAFPLALLREALAAAAARGLVVTDEAAAVEALGRRPRLVEGSPRNLKITRPDDLDLAAWWLGEAAREESS